MTYVDLAIICQGHHRVMIYKHIVVLKSQIATCQKVQVGYDQEKAQSEKNTTPKTEEGKT